MKKSVPFFLSDRRFLIMLLFGFYSGLPAALTAGTLQAWFTVAGLDLHVIGDVTLLVLPYSISFLWAPVFDHFRLPWLDRRRSWLLVLQAGLVISILVMAATTPLQKFHFATWTITLVMMPALITAFLSASQDVVINAFQRESFADSERGFGAALYVAGWRVGVIVSGALALIMASVTGWQHTYTFMAMLMASGLVVTLFATSPKGALTHRVHGTLLAPFREFFQRYGLRTALIFFLVIITYKMGDALALALNSAFLLGKMKFTLATVGSVNKTISIVAALLGGLLAGFWMKRMSLYRALIVFGLIQALANLGYAAMAVTGKSYLMLVLVAFLENFCSGMGTIALLALILTISSAEFAATQVALLSALAFFTRVWAGPVAASLVSFFGWSLFFVGCFLVSLIPLLFVRIGKKMIER